ncbi:Protein folded gastrulation [Operophtera brumata]|uniref:Protein folded gastrulation n=1 Tax=Operophtera brumata TaxID=104452 RepID=A0A0L7L7R6_OPEBR|nr:Protein folded gastrulation [Operophtera brumata]
MWHKWTTLLLVCCALVSAEETTTTQAPEALSVVTTRAPPQTLDRKSPELAWKTWLQSPENRNQNSPPRRITTKSLFITPLVCPKGQRLDRNGCVQVITVNKEEHERILLDQLNALFTSAPSGDLYDYGDDEIGPLQLSIPIGLDPQAAPLQGQEPSAQAQELHANNVKVDKKDENKDVGSSIEAELEILKLQSANNNSNPNKSDETDDLTVVLNSYADKPKRDSTAVNATDTESANTSEDVGQKEQVFGHVNVDPVLYDTNDNVNTDTLENVPEDNTKTPSQQNATSADTATDRNNTSSTLHVTSNATENSIKTQILKKDGDQTKLNPENDYSDIGEAIKLISRYAEVTTDDNFSKDQKKYATKDDSILGTRTKLQHRRGRPKESETMEHMTVQGSPVKTAQLYSKDALYFRYPWPSQHTATPPPDYPFRHLQDYWPGRNQFGGVYNTHENPRRHHHSYPHNFRPHGYPYVGLPGTRDAYPEQLKGYIHRVAQHHASPVRPNGNNQDLYSLLGLRHWFSSEGTSKR